MSDKRLSPPGVHHFTRSENGTTQMQSNASPEENGWAPLPSSEVRHSFCKYSLSANFTPAVNKTDKVHLSQGISVHWGMIGIYKQT